MVVKSEPIVSDIGEKCVTDSNKLLKNKCGSEHLHIPHMTTELTTMADKFKAGQAQSGIQQGTGKNALEFDSAAMRQYLLSDPTRLVSLLPLLAMLA